MVWYQGMVVPSRAQALWICERSGIVSGDQYSGDYTLGKLHRMLYNIPGTCLVMVLVPVCNRGIAQLARARVSGTRGRQFKSGYPDRSLFNSE